MTDETSGSARKRAFQRQWHYRPEAPVQVSPFIDVPPQPARMVRWITDRWFPLTENALLIGIACFIYAFFQPSLDEARTLELGWIAQIYLRNLVLMIRYSKLQCLKPALCLTARVGKAQRRLFDIQGGNQRFKHAQAQMPRPRKAINRLWHNASDDGLSLDF